MKLNFLYQFTATSRTLDYGATSPDPHSLCPQLNLLNPPPPRLKFLGTPLLAAGWLVICVILETDAMCGAATKSTRVNQYNVRRA